PPVGLGLFFMPFRPSFRLRDDCPSVRIWSIGSPPADADITSGSQTIGELCRVMLDVPKIDELMFELGHLVSRKSGVLPPQIERVDRGVHDPIEKSPVTERLFPRVGPRNQRQRAVGVRLARDAVVVLGAALMLRPGPKRLTIRTEIGMREE